MGTTDSAVTKFGKPAVLIKVKKAENDTGTKTTIKVSSRNFKIIRRDTSQEKAARFVQVNTNTETRKNTFQEINNILAEG